MLQPTRNNSNAGDGKKSKKASTGKKALVKKIIPLAVAAAIILIAVFGVSKDDKEKTTSEVTSGAESLAVEPEESLPELIVSTPGVDYTEITVPQESTFKMNGSSLVFGEDIMFSGASPQADATAMTLGEYCAIKPVNGCSYRFSNNQIDVKHTSGAIFSIKCAVAPANVQDGYEELDDDGNPIGSISENMDAHLTSILTKGGADNIKLGTLFGGSNGRTAVGEVQVDKTKYSMRVAACTYENELYLMTCLYNNKSEAFVNYLFGAVQIDKTEVSFS